MAAVSSGRSVMEAQIETQNSAVDLLKKLYPAVNEEVTPLPRAWSPKEKYNYIGLSQNNLRVHYKGRRSGSLKVRIFRKLKRRSSKWLSRGDDVYLMDGSDREAIFACHFRKMLKSSTVCQFVHIKQRNQLIMTEGEGVPSNIRHTAC